MDRVSCVSGVGHFGDKLFGPALFEPIVLVIGKQIFHAIGSRHVKGIHVTQSAKDMSPWSIYTGYNMAKRNQFIEDSIAQVRT